MTFTDQELEMYIKEFEHAPDTVPLKALLNRLIAAENVMDTPHHPSHIYPEEDCLGCLAMGVWRKSAGK